jgi:Bifunctional DNA primase/polymerase, N-terminal
MATFPSELGEGALALAAEQPVLPLEPAGKRPLGGLGLRSATQDRETVASWWSSWPEANVGLRCDGLVVVDVDGETGKESLQRLERRYGLLPATRAAQTGKGRHLFFSSPVLIGNSTAPLGRPPGIDLRGGARGYVVAPPSCHASGRRYCWLDERPPEPLPAGWRVALTVTVHVAPAAAIGEEAETAYGRAALDFELERLLRARPGERNEKLNASVFRLAQLVAGGQLPRARVVDDCLEAAALLGLGARESRLTVRSALTAGLNFPRFPRACARTRDSEGVSIPNRCRGLETFLRIER